MPVTVTAAPTAPAVIERLVILGAPTTVKLFPLLAVPETVITTLPVVAPVGTVATMLAAPQLVAVAVVPLNFTVLDPWAEPKFVPAIVTDAPTAPVVGDRLVIVGAAAWSLVANNKESSSRNPGRRIAVGPIGRCFLKVVTGVMSLSSVLNSAVPRASGDNHSVTTQHRYRDRLLNSDSRGVVVQMSRTALGIGFCIYVSSFFLVAASGPGPESNAGSRGYFWAWWALVLPWSELELWSNRTAILLPATAIVGLINPVFLMAVFALVMRLERFFTVLKIVLLSMLPFCWVPFLFGIRPREGYALWIIGMVLTLFSNRTDRSTPSLHSKLISSN